MEWPLKMSTYLYSPGIFPDVLQLHPNKIDELGFALALHFNCIVGRCWWLWISQNHKDEVWEHLIQYFILALYMLRTSQFFQVRVNQHLGDHLMFSFYFSKKFPSKKINSILCWNICSYKALPFVSFHYHFKPCRRSQIPFPLRSPLNTKQCFWPEFSFL